VDSDRTQNEATTEIENATQTQTSPINVGAQKPGTGGAVSPPTLGAAAASSAVAAIVTSALWSKGAVASAAATPVIVSLVKEGLHRPTKHLTQIRQTLPRGPTELSKTPQALQALAQRHAQPKATAGQNAQFAQTKAPSPLKRLLVSLSKRRLRVALATGLLGFVIAAAMLTVPELVFGSSVTKAVTGKPSATTLFGGSTSTSQPSRTALPTPSMPTQGYTRSQPTPQDNAPQRTTPTTQSPAPSESKSQRTQTTPTQTSPQRSGTSSSPDSSGSQTQTSPPASSSSSSP
jgi:hypothetical protein